MNPGDPTDSRLSIGYYSPGWPLKACPNGVVSYVADMHETLNASGHRSTVVSASIAGDERDPSLYDVQQTLDSRSLVERGLDSLRFRLSPRTAYTRMYRRALLETVRRAIAERQIQLFEIEEAFGWAHWIRPMTPIPVCVRLHGPWFLNGPAIGLPDDEEFRRRVGEEGRGIAAATAITAPSHDVLDRTRAHYGLDLEGAFVTPPPTPPIAPEDRWRPEGADPNLVLFIGRFDRHKGGDLMIEAFGRVLREIPEARLSFVGPDKGFRDDQGRVWALEEFVRDRIPGALESGAVTLHGQQPFNVLDEFRRKAAVNVVSSRYETICRVLMEAMAMGCPFVASWAGGIREAFQKDVDGLSHRMGDSEDLAAQIIALLKDPARAAAFGRQAARTCEERYHPRVVTARLTDFYRAAIERNAGRPAAVEKSATDRAQFTLR